MHLHILRAFYIVYTQTQCLHTNTEQLNILDYGFKIENDLLVPATVTILLPPSDELIPNCSCKVCAKKTCVCVAAKVQCCSFCFCHKNKTCKNKYNNVQQAVDTLHDE